MFPKWAIWPVFWLFMGLALGGSFVWGLLYQPVAPAHQVLSSNKQNESHSEQPAQTTDRKPEGSVTSPIFVQIVPTPKSAEERAQETEEREEKKSADRWLVRWTAALFAATIGLILATGVLGYFGLQQSRDMKASIEVARAASDAAKKSADVAAEQAKLTREAMRASVYVQGFDGLALKDEMTNKVVIWQLRPVWQNTGTTGTRHMVNHVSWKALPGEIPADFPFQDFWDKGEKQEPVFIVIGPQSNINGRTVSIPATELVAVSEGRQHVYVWGWAEYDEVFSDTPRHRIEFCVELKVLADPTVSNFSHISPSFEVRHNGADEECGQRYLDAQKRRPRFATT